MIATALGDVEYAAVSHFRRVLEEFIKMLGTSFSATFPSYVGDLNQAALNLVVHDAGSRMANDHTTEDDDQRIRQGHGRQRERQGSIVLLKPRVAHCERFRPLSPDGTNRGLEPPQRTMPQHAYPMTNGRGFILKDVASCQLAHDLSPLRNRCSLPVPELQPMTLAALGNRRGAPYRNAGDGGETRASLREIARSCANARGSLAAEAV